MILVWVFSSYTDMTCVFTERSLFRDKCRGRGTDLPQDQHPPYLNHITAEVCYFSGWFICRHSWVACLEEPMQLSCGRMCISAQPFRERLGLISLVIFHLPLYQEKDGYSLNCLYCFFQWDGFDKCFILNLFFPGLRLCFHSSRVTLTRNRINSILYFQLL